MEPAKRKVLILSSKKMMGDGKNIETMDYSGGSYRSPSISLIIPAIELAGVSWSVINWLDLSPDLIETETKQGTIFIIGPIWDYQNHSETFINVLTWFEKTQSRLVNPADLVLWNMNKLYLGDLDKIGLAIPQTVFIPTPTEKSWAEVVKRFREEIGGSDVVLKPFIGAGADHFNHLKLSPEEDEKNEKVFEKLKKLNRGIIVQKYMGDIRTKGEMGFVFFGDEYQYLILKVPRKGSDLANGGYWEMVRNEAELDAQISYVKSHCRKDFSLTKSEVQSSIETAKQYMKKFFESRKGKSVPRYARMDCVLSEGKVRLMELELIEPYLNFGAAIEGDAPEDYLKKYVASILN